jgi:hypothetical protein
MRRTSVVRRAALPAAALVVYAATCWLARVDLAVPGARSGELPAIVAEAARLERPAPVGALAAAPARAAVGVALPPLLPARGGRTGAREEQGAATAFQHANLSGSTAYVAQPHDSYPADSCGGIAPVAAPVAPPDAPTDPR